jgi:hypothetical protein
MWPYVHVVVSLPDEVPNFDNDLRRKWEIAPGKGVFGGFGAREFDQIEK